MRLPLLATGLALASPVLAILVAPGSPCASKCGNVLDSTSSEDVPCDESAYSSGAGAVFKSCLDCQLRSTYFTTSDEFKNKKESDLQWMICKSALRLSFCPLSFSLRVLPSFESKSTAGPRVGLDLADSRQTTCDMRRRTAFSASTTVSGTERPASQSKTYNPHWPDPPTNTVHRTACGEFEDAVSFEKLATNVSSYDYCAKWQPSEISHCLSCLRPREKHLLNNCTPRPILPLPATPPAY